MKPLNTPKLTGMTAFIIIWIGQVVSVLASGMSHFALSLWMYEQTRSATAMALMQVFFITPFLVMSIPAGVMIDRYNRKLMMALSDLTAILATGGIFLLYATGHLEFWHLYIAAALNGIGNTFQWPAYSAAISTMIPKEQYSRANGLMSLMEAGPNVIAPLLAGALYPVWGLTGLLAFDVVTFFFAIGALLIVHVPQPTKTQEGKSMSQGGMLNEARAGFLYILQRPSLLGLQITFLFGNLFTGIAYAVMAPMVLARTDMNSIIFGSVQSAGATGGVLGGILMSTWKGFKRRSYGVILGWMFTGICIMPLLGIGRDLNLWAPTMLIEGIVIALLNTSNQALWQAKVAPDLQGRVFSARRLIAWMTNPISPIIGGVLADQILEPAMQTDSLLNTLFSPIVGSGPGAGMGLLFLVCGVASGIVGLLAFTNPNVREADTRLPDHDQLEKATNN